MLSAHDLKELGHQVAGARPSMDPTAQRVAVALYRLLASGTPVTAPMIAEQLGLGVDRVAAILEPWPGVFCDDQKQIVAFGGLAITETPHRFTLQGRKLYTWCAWDSLFIPGILGLVADVESNCPTTGNVVSLTVRADGVTNVQPATTVVSFLKPKRSFDANVVGSFCQYVRFFSSETAGQVWTAKHPDMFLLSVEQAFDVGAAANTASFGAAL
jgi:alkylmercury lyase